MIKFDFAHETKEYAQKMLYATDWVTCSDVALDNLNDFINYRKSLRQACLNPKPNFIFDSCPEPIWSTPSQEQ
jgi:hypothetical protein